MSRITLLGLTGAAAAAALIFNAQAKSLMEMNISSEDAMVAYEAADVTIAPGSDDPLALSVLESFAVGTPVLACARNAAAVEHCRRAGAGLYYANRQEFVEMLRMLMTRNKLREQLGESGRQYVRQYYRWDAVLGRFERLITLVRARG